MQRFELDAIAPQPWRNGAGSTRLIGEGRLGPPATLPAAAREGVAAGEAPQAPAPDWRISVADITGTAPFSVFPGIDRRAVLIRGRSLVLQAAASEVADGIDFPAPGSIACFPGEARLVVGEAAPGTRLFNLMIRRGRASASLRVARDAAPWLPAGTLRLVLVVEGTYATPRHADLGPGAGLVAMPDDDALGLRRTSAEGWVVVAAIRPVPEEPR